MIITGKSTSTCACCGNAGGCALSCQSISGSTNFCGFSKFTTSDPPRFFGTKVITGTFAIGGSSSLSNPPCNSATAPNAYYFSGAGVACPGDGGCPYVNITASLVPTGLDGLGNVIYKASIQSTCTGSSTSAGFYINGAFHNWNDGDTHAVPPGGPYVISCQNGICSLGSQNITVTLSTVPQYNDTWNIEESFDLTTQGCPVLVNTNTSTRLSDNSVAFPSGGGTPIGGALTISGPSYSSAATVTTTDTQRITAGTNSCAASSAFPGLGAYIDGVGSVTELLTNEDTLQTAVQRATNGKTWGGLGSCLSQSAYCSTYSYLNPDPTAISFRRSQYQATVGGLTPGANYQLTIGIYSRPYPSTGAFTHYADQIYTFTASATTDTTPFTDVPLVNGMETVAQTCQLTAL